jgi:hypothetical protein
MISTPGDSFCHSLKMMQRERDDSRNVSMHSYPEDEVDDVCVCGCTRHYNSDMRGLGIYSEPLLLNRRSNIFG